MMIGFVANRKTSQQHIAKSASKDWSWFPHFVLGYLLKKWVRVGSKKQS